MSLLAHSLTERFPPVVADRIIRPLSPRTNTNMKWTEAVGKSRRYMCVFFLSIYNRHAPVIYPYTLSTEPIECSAPSTAHTQPNSIRCADHLQLSPIPERERTQWSSDILEPWRHTRGLLISGLESALTVLPPRFVSCISPHWTMVILEAPGPSPFPSFRDLIVYHHYLLLTAYDMRQRD